jgi:hypothetical protein
VRLRVPAIDIYLLRTNAGMRRWNRGHGIQFGPRRSPPEVFREVGGLGEALEEVVKEACLVNFRCKICPTAEACLLARLRYVVVECALYRI